MVDDYDDRATPIPFLVVEAALMSLADLLKPDCSLLNGRGIRTWDIKYQIALDIAAGLQLMHKFNIVHGDVKPGNVLIFSNADSELPYIAKLSDFGVCIDMQQPGSKLTPDSYLGTDDWIGPEARYYDSHIYGEFSPDMLKKFDSYSYGMVLLAIFFTFGKPLEFDLQRKNGETNVEIAIMTVLNSEDCPSYLFTPLRNAFRILLSPRPGDRQLPSPDFLKSDAVAYEQWQRAGGASFQPELGIGYKDFTANRGPLYWRTLDTSLLDELDRQFEDCIAHRKRLPFSGATLLGMCQSYLTSYRTDYREKGLKYMLAASKSEYLPAQVVCSKICEAIDISQMPAYSLRKEWQKLAQSQGALFSEVDLISTEEKEDAKGIFHLNGGYCNDPFLQDQKLISIAKDPVELGKWMQNNTPDTFLDTSGNCMIHACSALGQTASMRILLESEMWCREIRNDADESPLYKACQGGQTDAALLLLKYGHKASASGTPAVSPLHWLFNFPEDQIQEVADALIDGGADVNYAIQPIQTRSGIQRLLWEHFPFNWPFGTPFHWSAFARNRTAMRALLDIGADIDAPFNDGDMETNALCQAVIIGEVDIVRFLLQQGADALRKDDKNRNLLHLLSFANIATKSVGHKFYGWTLHGSWEKRLAATKEIVQLLLDAGVDIHERCNAYNEHTPLTQSSRPPDCCEHVTLALLQAGADANASANDSQETALHGWAGQDARHLEHPEAYPLIMEELVKRTRALDSTEDIYQRTPLHNVASGRYSLEQVRTNIEKLTKRDTTPADINFPDKDGYTPLMLSCCFREEIAERASIFLEYGARPDYITDEGENVITTITHNTFLMDEESCRLIEMFLFDRNFDTAKRKKFILETDVAALGAACYDGKAKTIQLLLDLGMHTRINEETRARGIQGNALDCAFFGADTARMTYLRISADYPFARDREEANRNDTLYAANAYGSNVQGQAGAQRRKEAYWSYPKIIDVLRKHGARRTPRVDSSSEPSFEDAKQLHILGFRVEDQPNRNHWQPLYELEILEPNWEEQAYADVKMLYEDQDVMPNVMTFDRWPEIIEVLQPDEYDWYAAKLRDQTRVKVKIEEGKVTRIWNVVMKQEMNPTVR